ncbi:hypothetical protein ET33_30065 [Paenibacillus tyrfis]|uniref:Uncharacterized protein n=1 Tax=Paenibacillus tyrfis TaxID=1501230 RepID=A0A081NTZ8_9BACL|nr:hypothetical protein ET33_30065 [Paenibacillus tyrfis]
MAMAMAVVVAVVMIVMIPAAASVMAVAVIVIVTVIMTLFMIMAVTVIMIMLVLVAAPGVMPMLKLLVVPGIAVSMNIRLAAVRRSGPAAGWFAGHISISSMQYMINCSYVYYHLMSSSADLSTVVRPYFESMMKRKIKKQEDLPLL